MDKQYQSVRWGLVTLLASVTSGVIGHYVQDAMWFLPVMGVGFFCFLMMMGV